MSAEAQEGRRRRSEVYRNLDDPLKVMGLLSLKSCGLLVGLYGVSYALDFATDFWQGLFGPMSFLVEIALFALAAFGLCYAEKQDDEHLVPAMLRYWLSGRWRVLYCGIRADGWPAGEWEWVFESRACWVRGQAAGEGGRAR